MGIKKIIVNADDFGLTESVNQAIVEIFQAQNLNSTTLMVNMPGTEHAVSLAKQNPGLQIGLHFCITEGFAITPPSSITTFEGEFYNRPQLISRILRQQVKLEDIRNEFLAQLERFMSFGIPLSHVDSHQHLHMVPKVFKAIAPEIERRGIPLRIVQPVLRHSLLLRRPVKYFKQLVNSATAMQLRKKFNGHTNDCIVSIYDLDEPHLATSDVYEKLIRETGKHEIIELMVHPFTTKEDVRNLYEKNLPQKMGFLNTCALEYKHLCGPRVINYATYQMIGYRDV